MASASSNSRTARSSRAVRKMGRHYEGWSNTSQLAAGRHLGILGTPTYPAAPYGSVPRRSSLSHVAVRAGCGGRHGFAGRAAQSCKVLKEEPVDEHVGATDFPQ